MGEQALLNCKNIFQDFLKRRKLKRDMDDRLNPYCRLILITGMARSGTSVVTAYIGSHPDVRLIVGEFMWPVLETDILRPEKGEPDWQTMDQLLQEHYPHRVLLKQPWLMQKETLFRAIRPAKVIVCLRDREKIINSWRSSERVSDRCKQDPKQVYNENIEHLPRMLKQGATWVFQDQLTRETGIRLGQYLGLDPDGFDASIFEKRWCELLEKEWIEQHSIKHDRRR